MHVGKMIYSVLFAFSVYRTGAAQPQCSLNTLRGTWAFVELGWTVPLGSGATAVATPTTVIGTLTVDSSGKITGSGTFVSAAGIPGTPIPAGIPVDFTYQGAIEITSDCTGVFRYIVSVMGAPIPGEFIERFHYSSQKDEMTSMSMQSALSRPLWIGTFTRLGHTPAPVAWPAISH